MSRAAERAFEEQFKKHLEDCARDLVVGATVYRAGYDCVEEGVVRRVSKCKFTSFPYSGGPYECDDGDTPYYVAQFRHDWVGQTYQWQWFFDRAEAVKKLVEKLRERVEKNKAEVRRWEALIAELSEKVG